MKKLSPLLLILFTLFFALTSVACGGSKVAEFTAFNTNIRIESHDKNISSDTQKRLSELFSSLESEFDKNDQNSFIHALNNGGTTSLELSPTAKEVFTLAKNYYEFSEGRFNPAVAPLTSLWQFDNYSSVVSFVPPQGQKVQELLDQGALDFDKVWFDGEKVYKIDQNAQIDLGGIVKGYAVDKALEIMLGAGHYSGYINIGNSSMALLEVESLNVAHPKKNGESILAVNTSNKTNLTLSTSGDYERYFEYQGKRYSHIIDPVTGYPVETGIASATVIGGTGAFTDAITTALCALPHTPNDIINSELIAFMHKITDVYPQSQLYIVYEKEGVKQIITNEKQGEDFTLRDNEYQIINI